MNRALGHGSWIGAAGIYRHQSTDASMEDAEIGHQKKQEEMPDMSGLS